MSSHHLQRTAQHAARMLVAVALLGLGACGQEEPPVYEATAERLYLGSVLYNTTEAGCKNCHGLDFKGGQGGTPDLTGNIPAERTPMDYFQTITAGSDNHPALQNFTDRGRWALANFLFSLATPPSGPDAMTRSRALSQMQEKLREEYSRSRRWILGFNAPGERPASPDLGTLITRTGTTLARPAAAPANVTENVAARALPGASIFATNCAGCHGRFGQGNPEAIRFGLINCESGGPRLCGVYAGAPALSATDANGASVSVGHSEGGLNLSQYESFTDEEWELIAGYLRASRQTPEAGN